MASLVRRVHLLLLLPLLLLAVTAAGELNAAETPPPDAERERLIRERNRFDYLAARQDRRGETAEAIASVERMLALERQLFGDRCRDTANSLKWLAELRLKQEQFDLAQKAGREALAVFSELDDDDSKNSRIDLRLILVDLDRLAALTPARLQLWRKAGELNSAAEQSARTDPYPATIGLATRVLDLQRELLGRDSRAYLRTLVSVGRLYGRSGDEVAAEKLFREAVEGVSRISDRTYFHWKSFREALVDCLDRQANRAAGAGDFQRERTLRQDMLRLTSEIHGTESWQARSDRVRLADLDWIAKLTSAQRQKWNEGQALYQKAGEQNRQGALKDAWQTQIRAVAILKGALGDEHPMVAAALLKLGQYASGASQFDEAATALREGCRITEKQFGFENPKTRYGWEDLAQTLDVCASLKIEQEQFDEARLLVEEKLAIRARLLGEEHRDIADERRLLAFIDTISRLTSEQRSQLAEARRLHGEARRLSDQQRNQESLELSQRALSLSEAVLGPDHEQCAPSLRQISAEFFNLGDLERSVEASRRMLAIEENSFPADHPRVRAGRELAVFTLNGLAQHHTRRQKYEAAVPLYRERLEIIKALYDPQDWRVRDAELDVRYYERIASFTAEDRLAYSNVTRLRQLGMHLFQDGNLEQCAEITERAIRLEDTLYPGENQDAPRSLFNLGTAFRKLREYERTEVLFRRALELRIGLLGEVHPVVVDDLAALARLAIEREQFEAASVYRWDAFEISRKLYGANHYRSIDARLDFDRVLALAALKPQERARMADADRFDFEQRLAERAGNFADVLDRAVKAWEIRRDLFTDWDLDTVLSRRAIARAYQSLFNFDQAEPIYREVLSRSKQVVGDQHPFYADTLEDLADLLTEHGKLAQAIRIRREIASIDTIINPESGWRRSRSERVLARSEVEAAAERKEPRRLREAAQLDAASRELQQQGRLSDAVSAARQAMKIRAALLNQNDVAYLSSVNRLSDLLEFQADDLMHEERFATAEKVLAEALGLRREVPAMPRWMFVRTQGRLEHARTLGRFDKGQLAKWRAMPGRERAADAVYSVTSPRERDAALEAGQSALAGYEELLGPDSAYFANALWRHSDRLTRVGQLGQAVALKRRAIAIREKIRDRSDPELVDGPLALAVALDAASGEAREKQDFPALIALLEECLAIRVRLLGPDDMLTVLTRLNLAGLKRYEEMTLANRDRFDEAQKLQDEAERLYGMRDASSAIPLEEQAQRILAELGESETLRYARSLRNLSIACGDVGRLPEAADHAGRAVDLVRKLLGEKSQACAEYLDQYCDCLTALGFVALRDGRLDEAVSSLQKSFDLRGDYYGGDDFRTTRDRLNLIVAQRVERMRPEERALAEEDLSLMARCGEFERRGEYDEAIEVARKALEIRRQLWGSGHDQVLEVQRRLAMLYWSTGALDLAESDLCLSLSMAQKIFGARSPECAELHEQLGLLYASFGNRERSFGELTQAVGIRTQIFEENQANPRLRDNLIHCAALLLQTAADFNNVADARQFVTDPGNAQTFAFLEQVVPRNSPIGVDLLRARARLYLVAGEPDQAAAFISEAVAGARVVYGAPGPLLIGDQAEIALARERAAEAEELSLQAVKLYEESRRTSDPIYASARRLHAEALELDGRPAEAIASLNKALRVEQKIFGQAYTVEAEKGVTSFLNKSGQSLDLLVNFANRDSGKVPGAVDTALAWTLRRKGQAFDLLCRAQELQSQAGRDPAFREKLAQLRAFRQRLANLAVRPNAELVPALQRQEERSLSQQAESLERVLNQSISARDAKWFVPAEEGVSLEAVRARLPPRSALVEIVRAAIHNGARRPGTERWGDQHYFAFVLRDNPAAAVQLVNLGPVAEIDQCVLKLRDEMTDVADRLKSESEKALEDAFREASRELYERAFERIRPHLAGIEELILAPDGELNRVPFAALVDPDGKYLIDAFRISYLSTGRDLLREPTSPAEGTVVFADPSYALRAAQRRVVVEKLVPESKRSAVTLFGDYLSELRGLQPADLPATADEAKAIHLALVQSFWGPVTVFQKDEALEDVLKAGKPPRLLHLATHGFFLDSGSDSSSEMNQRGDSGGTARLRSSRNPLLRSGLLLAGAGAFGVEHSEGTPIDDGLLTAEEVALLDLHGTELVVLSACESGLGEIIAGEGVYGLRRAFQYAGARTLVTSLFKVPDSATSVVMKAFYQGLKDRKDELTALHDAQVSVRSERKSAGGAAHPFFWASFILVGPH